MLTGANENAPESFAEGKMLTGAPTSSSSPTNLPQNREKSRPTVFLRCPFLPKS